MPPPKWPKKSKWLFAGMFGSVSLLEPTIVPVGSSARVSNATEAGALSRIPSCIRSPFSY
jgi:hypothetical protein